MNDLVKRLRVYGESKAAWVDIHVDLFEAADEIERLEEELDEERANFSRALDLANKAIIVQIGMGAVVEAARDIDNNVHQVAFPALHKALKELDA